MVFTSQQVDWPEAWNERRPPPCVVLDLRDHGSVEIDAVAPWRAALAAAGNRPALPAHADALARVLGVALAAVVGLTLFYREGTPWAATQLTRFVPLSWETSADRGRCSRWTRARLPSALPRARQDQLQARFDALVQQTPAALHRYRGYRPPLSLEFRAGMGANAFALPGGKIGDDRWHRQGAAADKGLPDDALVGVLAHEIGHVVHRHTTRMVVEQGVLQMGLGLALGDVSGHGVHGQRAAHRAVVPPQPRARGRLLRHRPDAPRRPAHGADGRTAAGHCARGTKPKRRRQMPPASAARQRQSRADAKAHPVWSLLSSHPDTIQRATSCSRPGTRIAHKFTENDSYQRLLHKRWSHFACKV